ncbi:MAG: hypothetical protein IJJ26_08215 [Victivallales bacterium]|nr:hypothetical protein [Victivallales bacterium]
MSFQEEFKNPPDLYRGTDFWMLNGALEEAELRRQLREMRSQGVASVIARTYIGLKSDYPGADFKKKMHCIVDTARELGMKIYLQAGYMPEAVLDLPKEFAIRILKVLPEADAASHGEVLATQDGSAYVAVNTDTVLDMLNKEAIQFYLKQSYEDMWAEFSDDFGKTCVSIWVDEPSYSSQGLPWSTALPGTFRELWGYDLTPKIPLLYRDEQDCETVRYHYWKTVQVLLREAYFKQVRDWCSAHHILFSGHLMMEDTLEATMKRAGAIQPFYKYFDIPGIDCLTAEMYFRHSPLPDRWHSLQPRPVMFTTPIQCCSAAHQTGQTQILAEMYGVSSENLGFREQKNMFDHFASYGINHRSVHGIFYSLGGRGKRAYPPHVHYYQPYWKDYKMLTDYVGRASCFISQGMPVKDVVVLHPLPSGSCEKHGPEGGPSPQLQKRDLAFTDLMVQLCSAQIDFHTVDDDTLQAWGKTIRVDGSPRLQIGKMDYATVVLPNLKVMEEATLRILEEFARAGGRVILQGAVPYLLDGWKDDSLAERLAFAERVPGNEELVQFLQTLPRSYRLECDTDRTSLHVNHRKDADNEFFFLFNEDCREPRQVTLTLPGTFCAECYPADGSDPIPLPGTTLANETAFSFPIPEGGSVMLVAHPGTPAAIPSAKPVTELRLPAHWNLERLAPNAHYLEFARYRTRDADFGQTYPTLAIQQRLVEADYHGPLTLRYEFDSELALEGLHLAMELPREQKITLNGVEVPNEPDGYFCAKEFATVPLPCPIRAGHNVLEISREYVPLARIRSAITSLFESLPGVELESLYLVGNFAVRSRQKPTRACGLRLAHQMRLTAEPATASADLTTVGYPFFAGTIALSQQFDCPPELASRNATLRIEGLRACHARVFLNGTLCGDTAWLPNQVPLANLCPGKNTIRIELTNTLRNLLGPHHRPKGEYGEVWGGYQYPNLNWLGPIDEDTRQPIPQWDEHREPDSSAWTEDYLIVPFGLDSVSIMVDH